MADISPERGSLCGPSPTALGDKPTLQDKGRDERPSGPPVWGQSHARGATRGQHSPTEGQHHRPRRAQGQERTGAGPSPFSLSGAHSSSPPQTLVRGAEPWGRSPRTTWLLLLTTFETWGKSLHPLCLSFHTCKMAIAPHPVCGSPGRLNCSNDISGVNTNDTNCDTLCWTQSRCFQSILSHSILTAGPGNPKRERMGKVTTAARRTGPRARAGCPALCCTCTEPFLHTFTHRDRYCHYSHWTDEEAEGQAKPSKVQEPGWGSPTPAQAVWPQSPCSESQGNAQQPLGRPEALPTHVAVTPQGPSVPAITMLECTVHCITGGSLHPPQPLLRPLLCERVGEHQRFSVLGVRVSGRGVPWHQAPLPTPAKAALRGFVYFILKKEV